ncbi:MBOAT-domain-containing protein [Rhodotorula sp. JG-1b]|nr:MBOAT-domain-containing protein [Rhodotorula sp. JG-1b]
MRHEHAQSAPPPPPAPSLQWPHLRLVDLTVDSSPSSRPALTQANGPRPRPRWRTKEFYCYYLVFLAVVPQMAYLAHTATAVSSKHYWAYAGKLRDGWIGGLKVDVSDHQYYLFRSKLPLLVALMLVHVALSRTYRFLSRRLYPSLNPLNPRVYSPSNARDSRARFSAAFSLILLAALHGTSLPKILVILYLNYRIARLEWTPFAIWGFNIAVLFANSLAEGYYYSSISSRLAFLDEYKGLLPRWQINWNISMLRLVSFNMEWYWAWSAASCAGMEEEGEKDANQTTTLDPTPAAGNYSFVLYLAYVLYPPLYLAGPIMTYPSFVAQLAPPAETTPLALVAYAVRFLACWVTMELVLHTMYVVALKDSGKGWWNGMTPAQVSLVGFWNLIVVWLKASSLLLPWRLFRLWSLLDGIVPPENMIRCMANNYSVLGFWRAWHRSYNLWVVRYLYIPLGGSNRPLLATLGVFTFVALWHDLRLRLLVWGWAITLFVVPEMVGRKLVPYSKYGSRPWYRHLAAAGGVANILLLMTANLVGFVVGVEGGKELWRIMLGDWQGRLFLATASACLFVGVQIMFEYREEERRKGISRKC